MRLVDADALKAVFRKEYKVSFTDAIDEVIDAQPTVEERKKGKWMPFEFGDDTWHKCTACGVADKYIDIVHRPDKKTCRVVSVRNFCPNCGAEMEKE